MLDEPDKFKLPRLIKEEAQLKIEADIFIPLLLIMASENVIEALFDAEKAPFNENVPGE